MSGLTRKLRIALLKGMEALGTTAASLASNAKLKVNEINLETRRREILTNFSLQAFELWQKGVTLPDPLSEMLTELSDIENRLSVLRAQKYAKVSEHSSAQDNSAKQQAQPDEPDSDENAAYEDAFLVDAAAAEPDISPENDAPAEVDSAAPTTSDFSAETKHEESLES